MGLLGVYPRPAQTGLGEVEVVSPRKRGAVRLRPLKYRAVNDAVSITIEKKTDETRPFRAGRITGGAYNGRL